MMPFRFPIERRVFLAFFLSAALALAIASAAIFAAASRGALRQALDSLSALADVVASQSRGALSARNAPAASAVLAMLAEHPTVQAARLFDADGEPLATHLAAGSHADMPEIAPGTPFSRADRAHLWSARHVHFDDEFVGTIFLAESREPLRASGLELRNAAVLAASAALLAAVALAVFILRGLSSRFHAALGLAKSIAAGNLPDPPPPPDGRDEIDDLRAALRDVLDAIKSAVVQIRAVSRDDYSLRVQPRSDRDDLFESLVEMATRVRAFHEQTGRLDRLKTGLADLYDRMRGEPEFDVLLRNVLDAAVRHTQSLAGAVYLVRGPRSLEMAASFGTVLPQPGDAPRAFGEGLVGQVAVERRMRKVSGDAAEGLVLRTAIAEGPLRHLVLVPLVHDQILAGVLELGNCAGYGAEADEFLAQAAPSVAVAVLSAQSRSRLDELLAETRQQSFALQEQQNALLRSNQELEERNRLLDGQKREINRQKEEIEAARRELEDKARELESANRYKSEFLANMSHELRTPLNSMLILSRLLFENKSGTLTPKQIEFAKTIHKSGSDLLGLINDILDLSKIQSDRIDFRAESVPLAALAESFDSAFRPHASRKNLSFSAQCLPGAPETIFTDPGRIAQILRSLLSNAFKFTHEGRVELLIRPPAPAELQSRRAAVAFDVRDTGIGIPPDKREIVFHAFKQADGTTSRQYGGTGLGLAVARELALRLGGDVALESEVGKGSTFTLFMPATPPSSSANPAPPSPDSPPAPLAHGGNGDAAPPAADPAPRTPPPLSGNPLDGVPLAGARILVVDDDMRSLYSLSSALERMGAETLSAPGGAQALDVLRADANVHLVFMDVAMPGMDGLQAIREIRLDPALRRTPVVALTAKTAKEDRDACLAAGANDYLPKPVDVDRLVLVANTWMRK